MLFEFKNMVKSVQSDAVLMSSFEENTEQIGKF